jgi:hypothetical protein
MGGVVMSTYFLYLALLLFMFLLVYYGVSCSLKFAPLKIRFLSLSALIALSLRYIALLVFLVTGNIKNIYLLKPLMFLNLLCLPVLALIAIYIYARNDKIKFNYCIICSNLLLVIYIASIIKLPISIEIYGSLGYIMSFNKQLLGYGTYLIFNTIVFFNAIMFLGNKTSDKLGKWLILTAALVTIIEVIMRISGMIILPALLFGDVIWIITADYTLNKLKK